MAKGFKRTPNWKMRNRIKRDRQQAAAEAADAPGYLICPLCDRAYRAEKRGAQRCLTPRCQGVRLVAASSLPARKPWERDVSGGAGPGTGKQR